MRTSLAAPSRPHIMRQELVTAAAALTGTDPFEGMGGFAAAVCPTAESGTVRVLVVAECPGSRDSLIGTLRQAGYEQAMVCRDSVDALALLERETFTLVLIDLAGEEQGNLNLLRRMKGSLHLRNLPVLVAAIPGNGALLRRSLELGAADFLCKPVDQVELKLRLHSALLRASKQQQATSSSRELVEQVERRTAELVASQIQLIHCLRYAARLRDNDTGHHVDRVGQLSGMIAEELGMGMVAAQQLKIAATLHDIGKLGIPESLLMKPESLTPDEYATVQQHAILGHQILTPRAPSPVDDPTASPLGSRYVGAFESPLLKLAATIAATHHERWDGTGYPHRLIEDEIPLPGRIVAVADVFDALSSSRPYKSALPLEDALSMIRQGRGTRFDPEVVDAFFSRQSEVESLYSRQDSVAETFW